MPRRSCCANSTAPTKWTQQIPQVRGLLLARRCHRSARVARRSRARALVARAARPHSPPSAGWRRTTTAWTARSRAAICRRCSNASTNCRSEFGLPVANVFHAGDGNLHPLILYDANEPGELERAEKFGGEILRTVCRRRRHRHRRARRGRREARRDVRAIPSPPSSQQFHAVKAAFDPAGLLNPGKAVPTLHRCAEFGGMHVHHGSSPFPNSSGSEWPPVADASSRRCARPSQTERRWRSAGAAARLFSLATVAATCSPSATSRHRRLRTDELVLTARAGTPLVEIEAAFAQRSQMLAFDPPHFGRSRQSRRRARLPACPAPDDRGGATRDAVLGVTLINGRASRSRSAAR